MGFRARKSIKIAPGVRMNFSKSGIGYSAGVKGYRVTKRADGRVQRTASLPGTGLSHVSTSGRASSAPRRSTTSPPAPRSTKPGMFAPKAEKELFKAVQSKDITAMDRIAAGSPELALAASTMAAALRLGNGEHDVARRALADVFSTGRDPGEDAFIQKYVHAGMTLEVVPGVTADVGLNRAGIGLALAELHQDAGDLDAAIDAVEQLEPTTFAALSLAELYSLDGRHQEVIDMTEGLLNDDNASALLCVFRGVAFRELGFFDAARESLKEALKSKKREPVIRHRALLERARSYEAEGKRAMAKNDLERIMAEDSTYEGLDEALAALGT